jgi:PAS domain S-box-containing protein
VPLEKLLGWGWTCRIHPDDVEAFVQKMRESFAKGKPFQETSRVRRADGVYRWMLHRKVPRFDGDGKLIKWHGSSIDIDDCKRAEEQLRKSERELRTLIDVMPAYVGTSLPDGTVDFLSQSWLDYFGQTREEAMGWGWAGVIHPDDVDRVLANWQAGLASGEPVVRNELKLGREAASNQFITGFPHYQQETYNSGRQRTCEPELCKPRLTGH